MPVKLNFQVLGEGPTVVILHGLCGSLGNWRMMAKQLSANHRVVTVDLRNHGKSAHTGSMTYVEMAEDVLHLITDQSLRNITLVGHSMGGKAVMAAALMQPELSDRIIVMDIAPVRYAHRYGKLLSAMRDLPLPGIKNRNEAEKMLDALINDPELARFLLQNLVKTGNGYAWRLNLPSLRTNIEDISGFPDFGPHAQFRKPALFLGGVNSYFIRPEHHPVIHGFFPKAEIEPIADAGHMLHLDQPEIVLDKIRRFITPLKGTAKVVSRDKPAQVR
ncbi:MAG: alpha/beta fold hydrolase [Gammaproteobacteria bacterium]